MIFLIILNFFLKFNSADKPHFQKPKNIILLIGDGMGLTQMSTAYFFNRDSLTVFTFPVTGLVKTHSSREKVTDSAAAATAMACGCKTPNGVLGLDQKLKPCVSILEQAHNAGMATGLIATSSLTHATPAAFVAHVPKRDQTEEIALAFLNTNVDLLIGGGMRPFQKRNSDNRDLIVELKNKGYVVYSFNQTPLESLQPYTASPFVWFTAMDEPEGALRGRDYLPTATRIGLPYLKQRSAKGFFVMIEGSQIDWAGHGNNGAAVVAEMLDFDETIAEALKFAKTDGETLVIVTADHETGGLAIDHGSTRDSLELSFPTKNHTATLVPIFAFGPGSELFHGVMDNTDIYLKMRTLLEGVVGGGVGN